MIHSSSGNQKETRMVFRVLAGIIAAFLLFVGLPMSSSGAFAEELWQSGLWAVCSLFAGIGLALGAYTGRWYGIRA
jgi:hypothetical protein